MNGLFNYTNMKTIYLYVKESPLGLKYLGITSKNPYIYKGSGKYWKRHLRKHGFKCIDISTDILLKTTDKNIISFWGMYYSKIWNIVESEDWANLIPESGEFSTLGYKQTIEARYNISIKNKGKKRSKEQSEYLSKIRIGRKLSKDTIIKISNSNRGKMRTPEVIEKLRIVNTGRKHTEEWVLKMRKIHTGNKYQLGKHPSEETKQKISLGNLGKIVSLETRLKLSQYNKISIIQYDLNMNFIKEWDSAQSASIGLNINRANISQCIRGNKKYSHVGGFKWKYK